MTSNGDNENSGMQVLTKSSYASVKGIFAQRCATCHNPGNERVNWLDEGKATDAAARGVMRMMIEAGAMPPPGTPESGAITDSERQAILQWADGISAKPAQ